MTAYSRRGFRVRLILEDYDDHRKKCFFFVNILREKYVRNVIQRIWHFFYKEFLSTPDELFLEIDDFFIPPGESTLVLKENDVISVRVRHQATGGGPSSLAAAGAVRSTVAPLTEAPETLVESVALVLRRLQDGGGPDDSERSERNRLSKVAEMMAAVSGSSDVSTDEEGVRDLANQLTSRQEVVRLSQKMADQATPPPPCAAKKHNLDSEHLSLTEISRELRRRYESARQLQPSVTDSSTALAATNSTTPTAAPPQLPGVRSSTITASGGPTMTTAVASPNMSMTSLDSPASLLAMAKMLEESAEAPGTSTETRGASAGATTSTPFTTPSVATRHEPAGISSVKRPTHSRGGGREIKDAKHDVDGSTVNRHSEGASIPGHKVVKDVKLVPRGDQHDETSLGSSGNGIRKSAEEKTPVVVQEMLAIAKPLPNVDQDTTPAKSDNKSSRLERGKDMSAAKHCGAPVTGLKRGRSPSSDSSSASDSSEEDNPAKSTPTKKPTTTSNTSAIGDGASTEKKKKTRTRRRRGKKRRAPETPVAPPPPPLPQPRVADYAQRHGLPRSEIDRYKRAASVGIGWQTRPKNRRVVFDDDGNPVSAGGTDSASSAAAAAPGRAWRGAMREGGGQWAWSQGRQQDQGVEDGRFGRVWSNDGARNAGCQSGDSLAEEDHSKTILATVEDHGNRSDATRNSHSRTSVEPHETPSTKDCQVTKGTTSNDPNCNPITPSSSILSSLPSTGTTASRPLGSSWDKKPLHIGDPALSVGESKRGGSLGSGLLPRAFMRPRRCVDPPRRSEVLRKPATEKATLLTAVETSRVNAAGTVKSSEGTRERLLEPSYLLASRAATRAGASPSSCGWQKKERRTEDAENGSSIADIRGQDSVSSAVSQPPDLSRLQKSESGQESCPDTTSTLPPSATKTISHRSASVAGTTTASSSTPVSIISKGTSPPTVPSTPPASDVRAPVTASHSTVVLDGSGRPAETDAPRDLRHLATSGERRPLVVVRRDRPLPGRAPYRETTKQEGSLTLRQDTGKRHGVNAGTTGKGNETGRGPGTGTSRILPSRGEERDADDDGEDVVGLEDRRCRRGNVDTKAGNASDEDEEGMDVTSSSDVYSNISVILAGPPLKTLSPQIDDSRESAEDSDDSEDSGDVSGDGRDSGDEVECLEEPPLAATGRADASVDSIANCNVVNAVGQNRRLEKQRARGLPAGGDKENQAPADTVKDDKFYSQFPIAKEARKGDLIAFKCWDMAADYSPFVSDYKEATVLDVVGEKPASARITLQLLEYRPRGRRRGRFEISTPDDDEVVDLEEESGIEERRWAELIQPRLLYP